MTGTPAGDLANALKAYADSKGEIAQHSASGYGAWLEDSFFAAYVIQAENDAKMDDPDETARKIVWGGRTHASEPATNLSGFDEGAVWKGLMVGHDMDEDQGATFGMMLKGNAMLTARVDEDSLTGSWEDGNNRVMDVSLTNIITADGTAVSRVADGIHWENLLLLNSWANDEAATFSKGSEITGMFYDNGNEVVGEFDKHDIVGVFGAVEYEMDDMASQ